MFDDVYICVYAGIPQRYWRFSHFRPHNKVNKAYHTIFLLPSASKGYVYTILQSTKKVCNSTFMIKKYKYTIKNIFWC